MVELQTILSSGDITEYKESGTDAGDSLLTSDEVDAEISSAVTGATGSFTAQSGETVTVVNGLITSIV